MELGSALRRAVLACAALGLLLPQAAAAKSPQLRKATNILVVALPVSAIGISLYKGDWRGLKEFALSTGLTVGTAYLLRQAIRDQRPDGSGVHGFSPPDLALADASSDYLWSRYGWRYGVPAYLASALVSYALTDNKKNHWYDTLGSGAIAFGFNYALVDRYHPGRYRVSAETQPHGGAMLRFAVNF